MSLFTISFDDSSSDHSDIEEIPAARPQPAKKPVKQAPPPNRRKHKQESSSDDFEPDGDVVVLQRVNPKPPSNHPQRQTKKTISKPPVTTKVQKKVVMTPPPKHDDDYYEEEEEEEEEEEAPPPKVQPKRAPTKQVKKTQETSAPQKKSPVQEAPPPKPTQEVIRKQSSMATDSDSDHHTNTAQNRVNVYPTADEIIQPVTKATTYRCNRNRPHVWSTKISFNFFLRDQQLFAAKGKGVQMDKIFIVEGNEAHIKGNHDAIIHVLPKKKDFSLQIGEKIDLMKVMFSQENEKELAPRCVHCLLSNPPSGIPSEMKNLAPKFNEAKGTWQLNFNGRFVLKSNKNCIMQDMEGNTMVIVRKTTNDDIELESFAPFDPIYLFFFGISVFMCSI